ncbi:PREDICTED: tRNA-splicing endonuclease subunit Sen15-like [Polistes canadensis]|uniref:tRNA-splicing endonuclease subunit Sen15-like n=1 Tax=Polistes canadensis TaxID=91411 RepID=UPI000718D009|nr:PREDICTED: tRNA-splicing endonuclease subunit Sen15-like [Polistes canadensis]
MQDLIHPSYYHMEKLGCVDPIKISNAFYVYMQLCEAKRFWYVDYKYNQDLDLLYLETKRSKNSNLEIYVPWPISYSLTIDLIEKIQQKLETERITFVFKSPDSTSVFYSVSNGLVKPVSPAMRKLLREKEEKRIALEKNIKKNTTNLYELAKSINTENKSIDLQMTDNSEIKNDEPIDETSSVIEV